jgi:hypothetical protein
MKQRSKISSKDFKRFVADMYEREAPKEEMIKCEICNRKCLSRYSICDECYETRTHEFPVEFMDPNHMFSNRTKRLDELFR